MADAPTMTLPRDEFTVTRRTMQNNPGAFGAGSTVYVSDDYGNLVTWIVETYREDGKDVVLLQRNGADGGQRFVLPHAVAAALASQRDRCIAQSRRRAARAAVETRRERGDTIGNPAALRKARKARSKSKG